MTLVIASQMEPALNERLAAHPVGPRIIDVPEDTPWNVAGSADIFLIRPSPAWRGNRHLPRPDIWPGRLRWVYSASVGIDFYPSWLLDAPLVTCGRGVASDEIADYVIAAILTRAKNLESVTVRSRADWGPAVLGQIGGTTVGIIGLGAIGTAVARRANALGARVVAVRRVNTPTAVAGVELLDSVEAVVASADHIVLAVPATAATHRLFDKALFARARPGAHIINIARGSVIDQEALIAALDAGQLDFATLDVTEPEPLPDGHALYTHPQVRLTPHVSSNYRAIRHRLLDKIVDDISRFARGEAPSDVVDRVRGY